MHSNGDAEIDMDLSQLRRRQVESLSKALSQFVSLKSSPTNWTPVLHTHSSLGGDVDVQVDKRTEYNNGRSSDVYRMTASIPLDPEVSRDTQGPYSAYLSELRDWQSVLECPGIRSQWNYYLSSSRTLEMLDAHTSITRSILKSPIPGGVKELAHQRELLMVETSLVDPTTVVYVSTSLPTTLDDPIYMRPLSDTKRVQSDIWAWCVEIATPLDTMHQQEVSGRASIGIPATLHRPPRVHVQVTCFMHLELGSWKSYNALACNAASQLIPSLVAHLRLHGAPPRLARAGPSISIDRKDWWARCDNKGANSSAENDLPTWAISYSVMADGSNNNTSDQHPQPRSASGSSMAVSDHPVISRIMDLENDHTQPPVPGNGDSIVHSHNEVPAHIRKMSSLTYYLSSSIQRRRGELATALGTHGGGILRDGEDLTLVATRARLGNCILEFIVDASHWHKEGHSVDVQVNTTGFANIEQLYLSINKVQLAAPELFTKTQLDLTLDEFIDANSSNESDIRSTSIGGIGDQSKGGIGAARRANWQRLMMFRLAGQQLVRCYSISSQKNGRYRYLVRIMNPPSIVPASTDTTISDGVRRSFASGMSANTAGTISISNDPDPPTTPSESSISVYSVSVNVQKGKKTGPKILVNGSEMEISPFSLDPVIGSSSRSKPNRNPIMTTRSWFGGNESASSTNSPSPKPLPALRGMMANSNGNQPIPPAESAATRRAAGGVATPALDISNSNEVSSSAIRDTNVLKEQDAPSIRLHQVESLPPSQWTIMGTLASGTIALSRAVIVSKPVILDNSELQQNTATNATDGDEDDDGHLDKHGISGTVLRAEATVEGWTIFDVFSVLSSVNEQTTKSISGLWSESRMAEQVTDTSALYHYKTPGTWATAVREASVCRIWNTSRKRGHIEIAECSLSNDTTDNTSNGDNNGAAGTSMVRAEVGLAAWVLDKSTMANAQPQMYSNGNGPLNPGEGISNGDEVAIRPADMQGGRLRNRSITTGSPAIDAEFENQRRKQQVVKITHYLQYNPQGWLNAGDSISQALNLGNTNGKMRLWPEILPTGVTLAMSRNITRMVKHLDENGAPPAIVWSRNASLVSNSMEYGDGLAAAAARFKYRLSKTASSNISAEYVEVEIRVEHRVWAYGSRADGTERTSPAVVELTVEPFYKNSSIACFVDPGIDPHATRIRIRHHRSQLLSRIVETDDADDIANSISVAWPTISVVVSRKPAFGSLQPDRQQRANVTATEVANSNSNSNGNKRVSSLFNPHTSNLTSPNTVPALVLPWSVPPRLNVNSVAARVRYLRRDESTGDVFYTRCLSVPENDISQMERSVPSSGGLHVEQLPDPAVSTSALQQTTDEPIPPTFSSATHRLSLMSQPGIMNRSRRGSVASSSVSSRVAINRYSVAALEETGLLRVATPQEYVGLVEEDFTRIRHEIELLDPDSSRSQWMRHLLQDQDVGIVPSAWSQHKFGSHGRIEYERIDECVHEEIPVTVCVDVLPGISVRQVARLLELKRNGGGKSNKSSWDSALFVERRELEYLHDKGGNVSVGHGVIQTPPLVCGRRDALTVARCEMTPFLPSRQRLRNWQQQKNRQTSSIDVDECSDSWGDYFEPTFTLVETSVPGSVPLSTMARASVLLYAVRVDPVGAYERLLESDNSTYSHYRTVCRVTVASCVDLGGSVPLAIRKAVSARIPGQLIAQLRSLISEALNNSCPLLYWPYMTVPQQTPLVLSRRTSPTDVAEFVAIETIEEVIDGCQTLFARQLNSSPANMVQAAQEYLWGSENNDSCYFRGEVVIHPALYSQLAKKVDANAKALNCLRKDAIQTKADSMPKLGPSANTSRNVNIAIPIISEVVVGDTWCKGKGISVLVSIAGNRQQQQLRQQDANNIPSGVWISPWKFTIDGSHLGVYVFEREGEYVVRVVLLPPSDKVSTRAVEEGEERLVGNVADNDDNDGMRHHHQTDKVIIEIRVGDRYHSMRETFLSSATGSREITCNGQRLRAHPSQAARHSLVSVETSEGSIWDACQECGNIGCRRVVADADERRGMAYGSDCDNSQMLSVSSNSNSNNNSKQRTSGNVTIHQGESRQLQQTGAVATTNISSESSFPRISSMLLRQRTNRHSSPAAADRLDNSGSSDIANYKTTATKVRSGTSFNRKHLNSAFSAQRTRKLPSVMIAMVLGIGFIGVILGRALASVVYG